MATLVAPVKTQLGLDELRSRTRTLGQRHRTVLLFVDGRRALSEVLSLAQQAGAQTSHFEDLVRMGMVELPSQAMAPEPRDTSPSAFDSLRVTSVELEVPVVGPSSEWAGEPQLADDPARVAGVHSGPTPPDVRAGPRADPFAQSTAGAFRDEPVRASAQAHPAPATGEHVSPERTLPVHPTDEALQRRQLPLAAGVRPGSEATTAPLSRPASRNVAPHDRADLGRETAAVPNPGAVPRVSKPLPPAPVAHRIGLPGKVVPRPTSPSPLHPAPSSEPMVAPRMTRPSGVPDALHSVPTLPMAAASEDPVAPPSSIRRSVLGRLASPRAGSVRQPGEPSVHKLERVRELLVETLRLDAPLFGMRMLVRLRAAVSTDDLIELVWDIERHLISARHSREEMLNLQRARELLGLGNTVVADDD